MNSLRIAKVKPNYLLNEKNYPSFLGYQGKTVAETAIIYIETLFDGGVILNGVIQDYTNLQSITINIGITETLTYDKIFNSGYLEVTINNEKYYYFVQNVSWLNDSLLSLDCEIDYWLTYWPTIEWNQNASCFIKRKLQKRYKVNYLNNKKYLVPHLSSDSKIHNNDGQFKFNNHLITNLSNLSVTNHKYNSPLFVNQLVDNQEDVVNDAILSTFGITLGESFNYLNIMYYAFVAPNSQTNFNFEKELIRKGHLPSGCFLIPIVTNTSKSSYIADTDNNLLEPNQLSLNSYEHVANIGNDYVVSIVALPIALHFLGLKSETEKTIILQKQRIGTSNSVYKINIPPSVLNFYDLKSDDIMNGFKGKFVHNHSDVKYRTKKLLNDPKLLDNEFTQIFLNIVDKKVPLFNYNVLSFLKGDNLISLNPSLTFSLNPHLYNQIIRFTANYLPISNRYNSLNLIENGLVFQQDLQLISTSNAYKTFLNQHKNAYNVSLAQGIIGVTDATVSAAETVGSVGGFFKNLFTSGGATAQAANHVAGAVESYKGVQAVAKDLKNQPTKINNSNTSDTYGFLTKQYLNDINDTNNFLNLNIYAYITIYQIPTAQLKIVDNYYYLHGYLNETLEKINNFNYFYSRLYFDYFEIVRFSNSINKSNRFNTEVINWFNTIFSQGVHLWHYDDQNKVELNNFEYNNWENEIINRRNEYSFELINSLIILNILFTNVLWFFTYDVEEQSFNIWQYVNRVSKLYQSITATEPSIWVFSDSYNNKYFSFNLSDAPFAYYRNKSKEDNFTVIEIAVQNEESEVTPFFENARGVWIIGKHIYLNSDNSEFRQVAVFAENSTIGNIQSETDGSFWFEYGNIIYKMLSTDFVLEKVIIPNVTNEFSKVYVADNDDVYILNNDYTWVKKKNSTTFIKIDTITEGSTYIIGEDNGVIYFVKSINDIWMRKNYIDTLIGKVGNVLPSIFKKDNDGYWWLGGEYKGTDNQNNYLYYQKSHQNFTFEKITLDSSDYIIKEIAFGNSDVFVVAYSDSGETSLWIGLGSEKK